MPIRPSYPGVYTQELPAGQHTIPPAATSTTAFIGRAPIGPTDEPMAIADFGEYQRLYGGLRHSYPLSFAVRDFFQNGGSQAIVARLFEPNNAEDPGVAMLQFPPSPPNPSGPTIATGAEEGDTSVTMGLRLAASSPGAWGNFLSADVDRKGITKESAAAFAQFGLTQEDLFNLTLTLRDAADQVVATERYLNVSVRTDGGAAAYGGRLSRVLAAQSNLARQNGSATVPPHDGAVAHGVGGDDGTYLTTPTLLGDQHLKTGMYRLDEVQQFDMLCIPPDGRILPSVPSTHWDVDTSILNQAASYCADRRAMLIVDAPSAWTDAVKQGNASAIDPSSLGINGRNAEGIEIERNAAVFFPRVVMEDPTSKDQLAVFPPCGIIAGVIAATDVARGVWTAPAGTDAGLSGVVRLEVPVTEDMSGILNPLGINCLRTFPEIGSVVWGSRTLRGADVFADDYKYLPVRRLTLFIENSLTQGTRWAVFEPNDEALWSSLRLTAEAFLAGLFRQGAFHAYKVSCDASTTTAEDVERGEVNILVQIAPVNPSEFVAIQITQVAGQQG